MSETPQEYALRLIGLAGAQNPLKVQAATPRKLARLIKGRTIARLRKQPAPGKWSITEILAHLADCELVTGWRMRQILGAPGTPLQAFDQDAWAATCHYAQRAPKESLATFSAYRAANLALLRTLTPQQWKHYGMHAERGRESIEHLARLAAGHDINHIRQIERILTK